MLSLIALYIFNTYFVLMGVFICYTRWWGLYAIYLSKKDQGNFSMVAFFGGLHVCFGLFLFKDTPSQVLANYWWIGILLDPSLSWEWLILLWKKFKGRC